MPASSSTARLEKLLVCTDDSPDSQGAVILALGLARTAGSQVYLLQVLTLIPGYELHSQDLLPPLPQLDLELMAGREAAVRENLEAWKAKAAAQGVALEVLVRTATAAYVGILEEAEALQPDLIIMGRHGMTGLTRLLMGSVTARVIGHSPFDVLVVPPGVSLKFKRLLVAHDGSLHGAAAWDEALKLALAFGATLIAATVAPGDREVDRALAISETLRNAAESQGVALETLVLKGRPEAALVKAGRAKEADLIILGSHGRTGLKRLLMGSVAERVIGQSPCAVLVVKRGVR
jgi:nucleotide-binding universal stress UspA family protein